MNQKYLELITNLSQNYYITQTLQINTP